MARVARITKISHQPEQEADMAILAGKAIVVTGSGRGIGATIAKLAASEGASVVVTDIDRDVAEQVAGEIVQSGGKAVAHAADITDWAGAGGLIQRCVDTYGKIDGLVNNAGLFRMGRVEENHARRAHLDRQRLPQLQLPDRLPETGEALAIDPLDHESACSRRQGARLADHADAQHPRAP
jgi:NAD(P)-dependent dehydrogenase (short-subunit alcohol dehydrogenase family)